MATIYVHQKQSNEVRINKMTLATWLEFRRGSDSVSIEMTDATLEQLYHQIGAYLADAGLANDHSSLWPEGEPLTAQQIRGALKPGDMVADYKDCSGVEFPE